MFFVAFQHFLFISALDFRQVEVALRICRRLFLPVCWNTDRVINFLLDSFQFFCRLVWVAFINDSVLILIIFEVIIETKHLIYVNGWGFCELWQLLCEVWVIVTGVNDQIL